MRTRLPSLNARRALEAAARLGSLTRAAAELHVTPSAVRHQIRALEDEIGRPLLRRDGTGVAPTEHAAGALGQDRKSVVSGKSVSVRVDLGGRRTIKTKKNKHSTTIDRHSNKTT